MKTKVIYIVCRVEVQTSLDVEDMLDEFGQETEYDFQSTDNISVISMEMLDVSSQNPIND